VHSIEQALSADNLQARIHAMMDYRSQTSSFWESDARLAEFVTQHVHEVGGAHAAERFWTPLLA